MNCKKCGFEIMDNRIKTCPKCGSKVNGLPTWAKVLIGFVILGIVFQIALFFLGIVAAIVLPVMEGNASGANFRRSFLKTISTLNQAQLMAMAKNDGEFTNSDDIWNKGIKENAAEVVDITEGIRLSNGVEVKYEKLRESCEPNYSKKASESTACAMLTIDVNGFSKAPNKMSTSTKIADRYSVLMYPISVVPITGSEEEKILYPQGTSN